MPADTAITPRTTVADLLAAHPELEQVLIDTAPAFTALRNPMLRRTIARVATLQQAAAVGGVPLDALIRTLRAAAGQSDADAEVFAEPAHEQSRFEAGEGGLSAPPPESAIVDRLDAREMLARGEHPMALVFERVALLGSGEVFELQTPFHPAPLVDKLRDRGYDVHSERRSEDDHRTYISPRRS